MAGELFKKAAAYRKKHPGMTMPEAVKILSGKKTPAKKHTAAREKSRLLGVSKKKPSSVGRAKRKKAAPKIKIKVKPGKKGTTALSIGYPNKAKQWGQDTVRDHAKKLGLRITHGYATEARRVSGIAGVSMQELNRNLLHLQNLQKIEWSTKELLKDKRHKDAWPDLRRQLAKNKTAIAATKKHITALKRSI